MYELKRKIGILLGDKKEVTIFACEDWIEKVTAIPQPPFLHP